MAQKDWQKLWQEAQNETDEALAGRISSLTSLKDEEIHEILKEADAQKAELTELMEVLDDASKDNRQKAEALQNINNATNMLIALGKKVL